MSAKHPLPAAALESDIAILGRKGGGKTITAKGIVERLLMSGHRVLVLDPLGGWWGLRSSADGEKPGFPIAVFGGEHGDYPIDPAMAIPLANVIATENLPAVLDIADMKQETQRKFLLAFLQELRRVNREPLTIVLEEADVFAPQNPQSDLAKDLHGEIDWIARRGRARGFRLITICQRPARLSKDVLTQASTLIAHVIPSPQDRDAVKAWVEGNGDKDAAAEVFKTLGKLHVGETWTWFADPQDGFLRRVRYPMIATLDTTATPRAGERRIEPKRLADVDMSAITAALEAARRADRKGVKTPPGSDHFAREAAARPLEVDAEMIRGIRAEEYERGRGEGEHIGFTNGVAAARAAFEPAYKAAIAFLDHISSGAQTLRDDLSDGWNENVEVKFSDSVPPAPPSGGSAEIARVGARAKTSPRAKAGGDVRPDRAMEPRPGADRSQPIQAVVDAIAWWNALAVETPSRVQVAFLAGYSPKSGTWRTYLSRVKTMGLVTFANNTMRLTDKGRSMAVQPDVAPSYAAVRKRIMSQLSEPLQKMLGVLFESWPAAVSRVDLAKRSGYQNSGSFRTYMSRLNSLQLAQKDPDTGGVRAARFMFGRERGGE